MDDKIAKAFEKAGIQMVTGDTYQDFTKSRIAMIMMFAEWCPHCVAAKPIYLKFATMVEKYNKQQKKKENMIRLGAIDYDLKDNAPFKERFDVYSVPIFIMFSSTDSTQPYSGSRTPEDLYQKLLAFESEERKKFGISYKIVPNLK